MPLQLRHARILCRLLFNNLVDALDCRIGVLCCGDAHGKLVPHPLPGRGEVEELSADCETVVEGDTPSRRMSLVGPVTGLHERCAEETDLDDLASNTADLHGVSDADAVATHQNEPSDKSEDKVL